MRKQTINKTLLAILLIFLFSCFVVFASTNHLSLPLSHKAYTIIESAQIRGIIAPKTEVRPYPSSLVIQYLQQIEQSNKITTVEKKEISKIIDELTRTQVDNSFKSMAKFGSFHTYSESLDIAATMGIKLNFEYTQAVQDFSIIDSRNGGTAYIKGEVGDVVSFFMDIGLRFDHLDTRPFLKNDFTIPNKGKYDKFWGFDDEHLLYYGSFATPEISASLLQGKFNLRWANIDRDWGPASGNLMLSHTASSFDAIELSFEIAPWLRYAFITGSLGKYETINIKNYDNFLDEYIFTDRFHEDNYNNNYSAHRVEVNLPWNFKFGIYESVVYRKRFELGYLNPLSIFMYQQNILGDFDNMLAGFDLQWTLPNIMKLYVVAATTEMNEINPKRFFIAPRNIMGIQAGANFNIPLMAFTTATVQYTYLGPFFYTHRPMQNGEEISFVNEGRNIGYALRPNSDEFLVKLSFMLKDNWDGSFSFKYQRRSGQYGFNIDKFMLYAAAVNNLYADKNFNDYVFEKSIGLEATINKTLKNLPIKFSISYLLSMNTKRDKEPTPLSVWDISKESNVDGKEAYDPDNNPDHDNYNKYPVLEYKVDGNWLPWNVSNALRLAAYIWF